MHAISIFIQSLSIFIETIIEDNLKAPFSIASTPKCRGGCFPRIAPLIIEPYLIMLSVKQETKIRSTLQGRTVSFYFIGCIFSGGGFFLSPSTPRRISLIRKMDIL